MSIPHSSKSIGQVQANGCCRQPLSGCDAPDPNLVCSICLSVFDQPRRTPCGHIFCCHCLEASLAHAGSRCPECRAPIELSDAVPDRLAAALVANLKVGCQFAGCAWVGRRGEMTEHLAMRCDHTFVRCPECDVELRRGELDEHRRQCSGTRAECPWGCGERPSSVAEHQAECLMAPQKLLAAINALIAENARLTRDNLELCAQVGGSGGGGGGPAPAPRTPPKRKKRSGPGVCID